MKRTEDHHATAAKFLVTYLREHGEVPLLMDLDDENHTLARFFPEALQINLHQEFAQDVVIEKAFTWFWHQRYLPKVEGKWSKAQQQAVAYVMQSQNQRFRF